MIGPSGGAASPPPSSPQRIGLTCPYSLSVPGGVQTQVMGLARALQGRGHLVRVLAPCDGPPPAPFVTPVGGTIQNPVNGSVAPIATNSPAQMRSILAMWDEEFDVVNIHEPLVPGPSATSLLLKSAPLVGTFHSSGAHAEYKGWRWLGRFLTRRLDVRVAVSEQAKLAAESWVPGEWTVLFNGVEVERIRAAEPWPADVPSILFVGRHEERKGLEVLLEALRGMDDDCVVWIAGEGPDTERLRGMYPDPRLEWLGRVSDDERDRRLRGATVFCSPALYGESFGVVLLEGMAGGAAVVASDIDGYRQVGAGAAEMVEPGNPRRLAEALHTVMADREHRRNLVALGGERAESFSMDQLASRYEELYARARRTAAEV